MKDIEYYWIGELLSTKMNLLPGFSFSKPTSYGYSEIFRRLPKPVI